MVEVKSFADWIKENFDMVLNGIEKRRQIAGNVCEIDITADTTKIYDMLDEEQIDEFCEVNTRELRTLIDECCEKQDFLREFNKDNSKAEFKQSN